MIDPEPPDCQACGACCFADNPGHVPITGEDYERLAPAERVELTTWRDNRCFMRVADGRCVNLTEQAGEFGCSIYERRPTVCRALERGSPACDYQRWRRQEGSHAH